MSSDKWAKFNTEILARLDIEGEYARLGLQITGKRPSSKGWLSCRAIGRDDKNPSAAINVSDGPLRGRYIDLGGGGESIGFWDFAAKYGGHATWKDARKHYAIQCGLGKRLPKKDDDSRPEDKLEFNSSPLNHLQVRGLIRENPGVTFEALQLAGARLARYPKHSRQPQYVVAIPVYGPDLIPGGPVGYVCMAAGGEHVAIYQGEDHPPKLVKKMVLGQTGLVNRYALDHLSKAATVWKVEGITDMLALQSLIPMDRRESDVVITNACGASETDLPRTVAHLFAGKDFAIIHDADTPGQDGAKLWIGAVTPLAERVWNVQLPFEIEQSHGNDLRDWINDASNVSGAA